MRVSRCSSFSLCRECCGALEYYDKAFDRITTRNEKLLRSIKRIFHTVTTTDDPVIRKVRSLVRQTLQCAFHCLLFETCCRSQTKVRRQKKSTSLSLQRTKSISWCHYMPKVHSRELG